MSCEKIIPSLPIYINFYYYYSYFMLFLTLVIIPLQFYIILTQSKILKSFKWLILNHTIWCLLFEILFASVKPLVLSPLISGYPLGLLKNGNLKITALATFGIGIVAIISVASLFATLLCRYLLVFPATEWFNKKRGIIFVAGLVLITCVFIIDIFYPFLSIDSSEFYKMAIKYDSCLEDYFIEPGFQFIPYEVAAKGLYIFLSAAILLNILGISLAIYFIYLVKTNISVTTTKISHSLTISSIVQLSISITFYFLPFAAFMGILTFKISHTENIFFVLFCFVLSHSFLESVATLYFVTPYRKAIVKLFYQFITFKPLTNTPVQISVASNFVVNR